jgi:X-X-X-Leu-X-X-Gly heptad repeat protein
MLPKTFTDKLAKDNTTLMLITFKESTSNQETLDAVQSIRDLTTNTAKIGGMSAMVLDTMNLSNSEVPIYVIIAVILCIIVLMICLDSYLVPFILLINIGVAILYNMGTNIFLGNISYITKAISAVLQLGVTTDFSIFLYHRYEAAKKEQANKEDAMVLAINDTFTSVLGSSLTTIAGFLALCTMTLLLGKDIGIVMAKGVLFGVICVLTLFPALILIFDKQIDKTVHKEILPQFTSIKNFVIKHYKLILIIFVILCIPAYIGNKNVKVYYDLSRSLPTTLDFSIANKELEEKYNIVSPEVILVDKNMKNNTLNEMVDKIKDVDGIDFALTYAQFSSLGIPEEMLPNNIENIFKDGKYQMVIINSKYSIATDELNKQISEVNNIVKNYDENAIVAGEGPLMKDMVNISNTDFNNVNYTSIAIIFLIMVFVLKSISLPIILVTAIEFAIFVNMASFYYTGVTLPFIASIVIGTIQLGATIDYAILMTTKYLDKRKTGADKFTSMHYSLDNSVRSIFTSGLCFFAATFGVGLYSKIDIIGAICHLIARGALISMAAVILILPSLLLVFDPLIIRTTAGFKKGFNKMKNNKKLVTTLLIIGMMFPLSVGATSKDETVYQRIDGDGNIIDTVVNEELQDVSGDVLDESDLENILNINGDEEYLKDNNKITWKSNGSNIYYQGTTTKKLPLNIAIKYYLDNEQTSIQDLNGKSGHITIKLEYTNLEKHGNLYTPFVVTMGTLINNDNNTNIKINNGKVVSNGSQSIIVGIATPGLSDSLNISELSKLNYLTIDYDTTDFKQTDIYNVYTPKLLDTDDLKVFDKLDTIYDDVNELSSASTKLVNGASTLNNGMSEYKTNLKTYKDGVANAYAGSKKITKEVYNSISNLENNEAIDATTLAQIKTAAEDKVKATFTNDYKMQIGNQAIASLKTTTDYQSIVAKENALETQLKSTLVNSNVTDANALISYLETNITNCTAIINNANATNEQKVAAYSQMQTLVTKENNLKALISGIDTYKSILNGLEKTAYNTAITTAYNTAIMTADSASQMVAKSVADTAKTNTVASLNTLVSGLTSLTNGLANINSATGKLYTATEELNDGTTKLAEGLESFDTDGIQKIANYVNGDLKALENNLKGLRDLGNDYTTFTKKSNNMNGETKFIVKIEANQN